MKRCVLDGSRLADAGAVYRALAEAFHLPDHFGHNPDALWDALSEYSGEPVELVGCSDGSGSRCRRTLSVDVRGKSASGHQDALATRW